MILLIFAVLSLTLISLWLVKELHDVNKALQEEKGMSEMRRKWADTYWIAYGEACSDKRDLKREVIRLETELGNVQADLIDERYVITQLQEEIEKQDERIHILKRELENEFEWSMLYSESADRLAGELEQTQETLNMLEHGYHLLKEEKEELEELLAHKELELDNANDWANSWEEAYNHVLAENEELKYHLDSLDK